MRAYLLIATAAFVVAVTGSDMFARMRIGQLSFGHALGQHLEWVSMTIVGNLVLLAPFLAVGAICAIANHRARTRSAACLFGVALVFLTYFYFKGFQAAEQAMLDEHWTAAALSIGLLPFFVGAPFVLVVVGLGLAIVRIDRRVPT